MAALPACSGISLVDAEVTYSLAHRESLRFWQGDDAGESAAWRGVPTDGDGYRASFFDSGALPLLLVGSAAGSLVPVIR